jgi:hypothetical protein
MCQVLSLGGGTNGGLPAVPEDEGRYSLNLSYVSSPLFWLVGPMEDFLRSLRTRDGTASSFLMCQVLCLGGGPDGGLPEVPEDEGRYSLNLSYV